MPPTLLWCPLNPQSKDAPVFLPADSPLVEATACLGWQPAQPHGGVSCVSLGQFQMIRAFISRCSIPRGGGDEDAAADVNLLATRFPASTWSRILTELEASGLVADFTAACVDHRPIPSTLERCLARLKVLNPEQLLLHAADFSAAGEAFETAAVLGHGRGRGRGAVAFRRSAGPSICASWGCSRPLTSKSRVPRRPLCSCPGSVGCWGLASPKHHDRTSGAPSRLSERCSARNYSLVEVVAKTGRWQTRCQTTFALSACPDFLQLEQLGWTISGWRRKI